jgi:mannose-6-phosphate isomerase
MRSVLGDGYQLITYAGKDAAPDGIEINPGLGIVIRGEWKAQDTTFGPGDGFEVLDNPIVFKGVGMVIVAEYAPPPKVTGVGKLERRFPVVKVTRWGYEQEVPSDLKLIQLKVLHVMAGHRTSLQYHKFKDEVMIFLDGFEGPAHYGPGVVHRVAGPAYYVEASTYHPDDVVRLADDYGRAPKEPTSNTVMVKP